jgi:hypothetical protein
METLRQLALWADGVVAEWKELEVPVNPGTTQHEIRNVENLVGFTFPTSFHVLYRKANGHGDLMTLPSMFSVWPLEMIVEEYIKDEDKNFIPFADFMINSWWLGFLKGETGIYTSCSHLHPVADDFAQAIDFMNADDKRLYEQL